MVYLYWSTDMFIIFGAIANTGKQTDVQTPKHNLLIRCNSGNLFIFLKTQLNALPGNADSSINL